jgi:hypothetical protein
MAHNGGKKCGRFHERRFADFGKAREFQARVVG